MINAGSDLAAPIGLPHVPPHSSGMRIGLLGGTFNPPHEGHRLISLHALRRLHLDRVWWLVTPGNPLKDHSGLPASATRAEAARHLARDPRIVVTTLEDEIGTRFTAETLTWLKRRCPDVRFVWMMGADNLQGFHHWRHWQNIVGMMPVAIFDRPGSTLAATHSRAALRFAAARVPSNRAGQLASMAAPAWMFFHGKRSPLSSTAIRAGSQEG